MRARGAARYSAPPLAASIWLPSAGSRPTPGKGPDAGQRFQSLQTARSGGVRAWPCGRDWANQGRSGPRALASSRRRPGGLPAPRSLPTLKGGRGGRGRHPAAASRPAAPCPPPLRTGCSDARGARAGLGAFWGSRRPVACQRKEELIPPGAAASLPPPPCPRPPAHAPAPLTQPGPRSAAARRRPRISRERGNGDPGAPPPRGGGEPGRGRGVLPQRARRRHTCGQGEGTSSAKEKRSRPRGGGRPGCSANLPTRSRHTCAGGRVRPAAEQAVTSLHKRWQHPPAGEGKGPREPLT